MSPVDSYYQVLDYLNLLEVECGYGKIDNTHRISKHLAVLMRLANQAEHQEDEEE